MNIIHSMSEYEEINGTYDGYYAQYPNTATEINIGDTFVVSPNSWDENIVEIVHIYDDVALGVVIKGISKGNKELYSVTEPRTGWKYKDQRGYYRLQRILNDNR